VTLKIFNCLFSPGPVWRTRIGSVTMTPALLLLPEPLKSRSDFRRSGFIAWAAWTAGFVSKTKESGTVYGVCVYGRWPINRNP
jgi:hypothetical protein